MIHEFFVCSDLIIQSAYAVQIYLSHFFLFHSSISSIPPIVSAILDAIDVNDPIGVIPLFVSLTRNISKKEGKTVTSNVFPNQKMTKLRTNNGNIRLKRVFQLTNSTSLDITYEKIE